MDSNLKPHRTPRTLFGVQNQLEVGTRTVSIDPNATPEGVRFPSSRGEKRKQRANYRLPFRIRIVFEPGLI